MKISQKKLLVIYKKTNGHCFYCGSEDASTIDHFIPKYLHNLWELKGFDDNDGLTNLFLSCKSCNSKKGIKHPEVFIGNSFITWSRWLRANFRVGLSDTREYTL